MSLNYLGIPHSPVLRRPLSSHSFSRTVPTTDPISETSSSRDVVEDNKEVLIERLNDFVALISNSTNLGKSDIEALHVQVDQIERIELLARVRDSKSLQFSPGSSQVLGERGEENGSVKSRDEPFWGPPSPTRNMSSLRLSNPTSV
jgi:hypothetical protein